MTRIGIDATPLQDNAKGLSRYLRNLIKNLMGITETDHEYFIFCNPHYINELQHSSPSNFHWIQVPFYKGIFWDQIQLPWLAEKYRLDLIHSAYERIPLWGRVPFIPYLFEIPDYRINLSRKFHFYDRWYQRLSEHYNLAIFPSTLKTSAFITTSSQFTKQELIQNYGVPEEKIKVVYPAYEKEFCPLSEEKEGQAIRDQLTGGSKYFLHFSTGDPRDNTETALQAFKMFRARVHDDVKLVIAGVKMNENPLESAIQKDDQLKKSIICQGFVTGESLVNLYQGAAAYVDPSLYEGFGFQPLEAMACGTPVIASNVTAIPEVVLDTGILLGPLDVQGFANAMRSVMTDSQLRSELVEKALSRSRFFNWAQTAEEISHTFDEVLKFRAKERIAV